MNRKQTQLIERLRLEVVCPAKARIRCCKDKVTLMSCNHRFLGRDEVPLGRWYELFRETDLNLEIELRKLIKSEIGSGFDIKKESYSGYLGITSDDWIEIVKTDEVEEVRRLLESKVAQHEKPLPRQTSKGRAKRARLIRVNEYTHC